MSTTLVWLRNDLRLADNPALAAAAQLGAPFVCLHIEETDAPVRRRGGASRWWLHRSLADLSSSLAAIGIRLETATGTAADVIDEAVHRHRADRVLWNRRYAPAERAIDEAIKRDLRRQGIDARSFPGDVLVEPHDLATRTGGSYGVFTPFWNALRQRDIAAPARKPGPHGTSIGTPQVDRDYRPPPWSAKLDRHWRVGEAAARHRLASFLRTIETYPEGRDFPARDATSRLSPHLAHGEMSPRQVWHAAAALAHRDPARAGAVWAFLRELAWRDFNIHQLYHRRDISRFPMQEKYLGFGWRSSDDDLRAWQRGETGIPLVDAGMRQLWETGFMHNRVRMVAASFLTKNLLVDWREGERWFWDTLVDADTANNPGNWQWIAGCGTDAAPYFRIFNPLTQARKFDPDGTYVSRWSGASRPPMVDLKASRERALAAYRAL